MSAVPAAPLIPTGDDDKIVVKTTIEKKKKKQPKKSDKPKKEKKKSSAPKKKKKKPERIDEAASNRSDVLLGDQVLLKKGEKVQNVIETQPDGCQQDNDCNPDQICVAKRCLDRPPAPIADLPQDDPNGIPADYVNPDDAKDDAQFELSKKRKKFRNRMFVVFAVVIVGLIIWAFASRDTTGSQGTGRTGDACTSNSDCDSKFFCDDNGDCVERDPGEVLGVASSTWFWLSWGAIGVLTVFTLLYGLINLIGGGKTKKDIEEEEEKKEEEDRAVLEEESKFFDEQKGKEYDLAFENWQPNEEQQRQIDEAVQEAIANGQVQDVEEKRRELANNTIAQALIKGRQDLDEAGKTKAREQLDTERKRIEAKYDKLATPEQYKEVMFKQVRNENIQQIRAEATLKAQESTKEFGQRKRAELKKNRERAKLPKDERKRLEKKEQREQDNVLRRKLGREEVSLEEKKGGRKFRTGMKKVTTFASTKGFKKPSFKRGKA